MTKKKNAKTRTPQHNTEVYSSHLVQYAQRFTSRERAVHSETSVFGNDDCKHFSEQNVRMSSTSHPSSIRWWHCSQMRTLSSSFSVMISSKRPSMPSSSTKRMAISFSRSSRRKKEGLTLQW